jgi:hypothetical protein
VVNGSLNDVLGAIKNVQDKNVYPVFIPSLQKTVMFKEMNTGQEKMIVKTIVDSPIYNSEFIFAIKDIINANCAEVIDIEALTIIDKTAICLTMRMKSIGDTFTYSFKNTDKTVDIKISDYVEKFKEISIPEDDTVGTDDIKIVCGYPTIATEYAMEKEFRKNVQEFEISSADQARTAIGNVFTNEIVKYIKEIHIKTGDAWMELDMSTYNFKSRVSILEEIGNKATSTVLDYIEKSNKAVRDALTVELELTTDEKKKFKTEKLTSLLEAGSDFFIIS